MAKKKKNKTSKRRTKKSKAESSDPIGNHIRKLMKAHKEGGVRGILTITLGPNINASNVSWAGSTPPEEMFTGLKLAERFCIDTIVERLKSQQTQQE